MTRLVAEQGKIYKESTFTESGITAVFRKAAISTKGEIGELMVEQNGQQLQLTFKQALSLANEIIRRCSA